MFLLLRFGRNSVSSLEYGRNSEQCFFPRVSSEHANMQLCECAALRGAQQAPSEWYLALPPSRLYVCHHPFPAPPPHPTDLFTIRLADARRLSEDWRLDAPCAAVPRRASAHSPRSSSFATLNRSRQRGRRRVSAGSSASRHARRLASSPHSSADGTGVQWVSLEGDGGEGTRVLGVSVAGPAHGVLSPGDSVHSIDGASVAAWLRVAEPLTNSVSLAPPFHTTTSPRS